MACNVFQRPVGSGRAINRGFSKFEYFDQRQNGTKVEYVKKQFGTIRYELEHLAAWLQHEV